MFTCRPAVKLLLPYALGIILGWSYPVSFIYVYFVVALLFITMVTFGVRPGMSVLYNILIVLLCVGFGLLKITCDINAKDINNINRFRWPENNVILKGIVNDLPLQSELSLKFIVDAETIIVRNDTIRITGKILVSYRTTEAGNPIVELLQSAPRVSLTGQLLGLTRIRNPGEFDYGSYLKLNDIDGRFLAEKMDSGSITGMGNGNIYARYVNPVRQAVVRRINTLIGGDEARFLRGLLVGERSDIPVEIETAFINAGVMHIIAVSGLHVVIIAGMIAIVLKFLRIPDRWNSIINGLLLIYYAFLTGGTPSVVRSVIMAIIYLIAKCILRKADIYNVLAVSALIILSIDSRQLFNPGFQLSFVSVLSIVFLYPRLNVIPWNRHGMNIIMKITRSCWSLFLVSLSAAVGTSPFISLHFGKISVIGIIANIIIVPLSNAVLAVGMVTIGISFLSMGIATVYAEVTRLLTTVMLDLVQIFGNLPFAYFRLNLSYLSSVIFYAFIGCIVMVMQKRKLKRAFLLLLVMVNIFIYRDIFHSTDNVLRLVFLDVGQGDAIVAELPGGENIVVDTGPSSMTSDAGYRVILPYLRMRGISSIDKLIITHPDADHIGGCASTIRGIRIEALLDGGYRPLGEMQIQMYRIVDSTKITKIIIKRGITYSGGSIWRMYVLHPTIDGIGDSLYSNDKSVVVKIVYGSSSLLLTGDIHTDNEKELIRLYGSFLESDILKLGHHGSSSSTSVEFIRAVRPEFSVISVGKRNRFHHPAPALLARLNDEGCVYYRTDTEGALIFESDGKRWKKIDWR